jgi:hypothetical protein
MYINKCPSRKQGKYTDHQRTIPQDDRVCPTEFRSADRITGYAIPDNDYPLKRVLADERKEIIFERGFLGRTPGRA